MYVKDVRSDKMQPYLVCDRGRNKGYVFVSSSWFSRLGAVVQKMGRDPFTDQLIHLHWQTGWYQARRHRC